MERGPGALYGHVGEMGDWRSGRGGGERSGGIWEEGLLGHSKKREEDTHANSEPSRSICSSIRVLHHYVSWRKNNSLGSGFITKEK